MFLFDANAERRVIARCVAAGGEQETGKEMRRNRRQVQKKRRSRRSSEENQNGTVAQASNPLAEATGEAAR